MRTVYKFPVLIFAMFLLSRMIGNWGDNPTCGAPDPATGASSSQGRDVTIPATVGRGGTKVSLGPLAKGQTLTFQYLRGEWTAWPGDPAGSPDDATLKNANVMRLSICERAGSEAVKIVEVPGGTAAHPFVFVADHDITDVCLNMDDSKPGNNVGEVAYRITRNAEPSSVVATPSVHAPPTTSVSPPVAFNQLLGKWRLDPQWTITVSWDGKDYQLDELWQGKQAQSKQWKSIDGLLLFRWGKDVFVLKPQSGNTSEIRQYHNIAKDVFDGEKNLPSSADTICAAERINGANPPVMKTTSTSEHLTDVSKLDSPQRSVVIVDNGIAMSGQNERIGRMVQSVFLSKPDIKCSLNIIAFSDGHVSQMAQTPLEINGNNIPKVQQFIKNLHPSGSSDGIEQAITVAMSERPTAIFIVGGATVDATKKMDVTVKSLSQPQEWLGVVDASSDGNPFMKTLAVKAAAHYVGPKGTLDFSQCSEATITPDEIAECRKAKLKSVQDKINKLQSLLSMMPANRKGSSSIDEKLDSAKRSKAKILAQSDASIADEVAEGKAQAAADAESKRVAAEQKAIAAKQATDQQELLHQQQVAAANQRVAAARAKLFPGWEGPWKTCPYCGGSGRDADAEREINTRNAGIIASQNTGTGAITKIAGAVVACPRCGGTGQVPDR